MAQNNVAQLASIIRYHLGELGARNGHHEFEHLSRHLARARVYSNILPATGPVSAGGDGGRDFETFRTGMHSPPTAGSAYAQTTSRDRLVVFACSLQKKIVPKIERDIDTILASGPVDEIVYFCEANLPVAKRQKLQAGASRKSVTLQVFDGQAISEMLVDKDTFWIAQEYLRIPADLMPRSVDDPDWYRAMLERWADRQPLVVNRADFMEIKSGLRRATFHADVRQDLTMWLARMELFLTGQVPRTLRRNAEYEVIVATYRGMGDFHRRTSLVDSYFSDFDKFLGLADLQDAATLLVYAWGAHLAQNYGGEPEKLFDWRCELASLLEQQMTSAPGPSRRSGLLQIRGYLETMPAETDANPDFESQERYWSQMLDEAAHAPLFPVANFADNLSKLLVVFGPRRDLMELASRADDLVANRAGAAEAGQKAFDRALVFLEGDHKLAAIRELHRARRRWFSGDRISDALNVMILLSDCYRQLGLAYAAKYYALSAAYVAANEQRDEISRLLPQALLSAVDAEDAAGNGVGLAGLLLWAVGAHTMLDRDPFEAGKHPRIHENLGQMQALLGFLKRGDTSLFGSVVRIFEIWPEQISQDLLAGCAEPTAFWNTDSWSDAWLRLNESLVDRPWGDIGTERVVRWDALGISWACRFENAFEVTPFAEQFIAALQLTQATVAILEADLALVSVSATLLLSVEKKAKRFKLSKPKYDGDSVSMRLTIPALDRTDDTVGDTVFSVSLILAHCSVLRHDRLLSITQKLAVDACEQAFNVRPYHEVYGQFVSSESFFAFARTSEDGFRPDMPFQRKKIGEIRGNCGPGSTYDPDVASTQIASRYAAWIPYMRFTLQNLMADPSTSSMLRQLRDEGMRDWHILTIVGNIVFGARGTVDPAGDMTVTKLAAAKDAIAVPENEETALGPDILLPDVMRLQRYITVSLLLNSWELDGTSKLVSSPATERFLSARYRIYEDDVVHENIFQWGEQPASPK